MLSSPEEVMEIFEGIRAVAFDMDGVLRIGSHPVLGASDIFKTLKKNQKLNNNLFDLPQQN